MLSVVVSEIQGDYIEILDLSDINHVKNVFRKNIGDKLRAVDGKNEYFCIIEEIDEKHIRLKIIEKKEDKFSLNIKIDAGISILKGDKMDLTIQKLTELGINKIIPILANRCVVKLDKKKDRWDNISKEALKQCQGVNPTIIDDIKKMNELEFEKYDLIIVPYESEKNIYIKEILKNKDKEIKNILYIIGPEGGFENEEIELLKKREAKIISLGNRILRAETAAIVTGGVIINEFF
ncbi:16S rRNA (uracil(1498)-N(3))-methyltransferase [Fusobacterium massiliense]|uniref:RsmE family RNA methyltransferase n=1 Tax=Fusobacterium massiliense TaxID=1852365 RepID=UPI0028E44B49|nr:16S rRNA (uracil(1498)-N(3))-methyltransferase [Fusobacterium massiliense]